jgi:hypothetical protein
MFSFSYTKRVTNAKGYVMRTLTNAEYQLEHIMPNAHKAGCECEYSEDDFEAFINYEWTHKLGCPAPRYECLPNARGLIEAMRHVY